MYIEECLARDRHAERLKQAQQESTARQVVVLNKMEKRRERAERELLHVWQAVDRLRSTMQVAR